MLKNSILLLTLSVLLTLQPSSNATNSKTSPLVKIEQPLKPVQVPTSQIQVYFSPNGGCTDAIVNSLKLKNLFWFKPTVLLLLK
jgi:hypothetical protein